MSRNSKSSVSRYYFTPVNTALILANVAVFIYLEAVGDTNDAQFMFEHGANFWVSVIYSHEYWRLFTCAFIHFGVGHLFNNMLVLAMIGDNLERALGAVKYLIFYLLSAIGASTVSMLWSMHESSNVISGGASGAIFGVVGGLLIVIIKNKGRLEDMGTTQIVLFICFTIYHGLTTAGIDNAAHIGGLLTGALLGFLMYRKKKDHINTSYTYYNDLDSGDNSIWKKL